jgi:hypothetical protein
MTAMVEATYPLREFRCQCGRLLFKARLSPGSLVQLTCRSCKHNMTVYIPDIDADSDIT